MPTKQTRSTGTTVNRVDNKCLATVNLICSYLPSITTKINCSGAKKRT
ncbi:hypothetical protein OK016_22335 [Vibrio chagasii]|nr:hypothetical protein [Vibrio chagasii]